MKPGFNPEPLLPPPEVGLGVTCRPQAATASAATKINKLSLRIILTSGVALDLGVAACAGVLLALAFPKTNLTWAAWLGAAALFWTWQRASWKRAFWLGWFAGAIFFAISFSWFGHTVGAFVGPFAPAIVLVPALAEGAFVGLAAILATLAYRYALPALAPLGAAAAFTIFEWFRSIGVLGVPFAQLGYSQASTPFVVFAAYAGTYGLTFVLCAVAAYVADTAVRRRVRPLALALVSLMLLFFAAWSAWPARQPAPPTIRVAAVQGDIAQSLKWTPQALQLAVGRYERLTRSLTAFHPKLVVWPETVITTVLNRSPQLEGSFGRLAASLGATLVVGSLDVRAGKLYNALFIFAPNGRLQAIYRKRQLVPFAESFPGKSFLGWLPYVGKLVGGFSHGHTNGVYPSAALPFAPLICWESAFSDLVDTQVRRGAQLLVVSTDDAWFGRSAGPYQHAQIAQLRAVEYGQWVVRAAATGVSGIIAPNGRYVTQTTLDTQTVATGVVGPPTGSVFAHLGPTTIGFALIALYVGVLLLGLLRVEPRDAP
ncbi:MAG: apolipoprotein N-acyltransferase [Vulcanimicrobiaceae bacterium]